MIGPPNARLSPVLVLHCWLQTDVVRQHCGDLVYWVIFTLLPPHYAADAPDLGRPNGLLEEEGVLSRPRPHISSTAPPHCFLQLLRFDKNLEEETSFVQRAADETMNRSAAQMEAHGQIWNKNQEKVSMVTAT